MTSFRGIKFTRYTDKNMFQKVLIKVYPELSRNNEGYFINEVNKGKNINQLLENLANDLSKQKLSPKFLGYSEYLFTLSKKNRHNDRTLKSFSGVAADFSKQGLIPTQKTKTKEVITTHDKNIVKMKDVDVKVVEGKIESIHIGEMEIIPERITAQTIEKTVYDFAIQNHENYLNEEEKKELPSGNLLTNRYPNEAKREVAKRGKLDEYVFEKLNEYLERDVIDCEKGWFSHRKCQEFFSSNFEEEFSSERLRKTAKIIIQVLDDEENDPLTEIYYCLSDEVKNMKNFTLHEKIYLQLKMLSSRLEYFSSRGKYFRYSDDEDLEFCKEEYDRLANLCIFKDIPWREFPMEIIL